jgi:hypothetical protein
MTSLNEEPVLTMHAHVLSEATKGRVDFVPWDGKGGW